MTTAAYRVALENSYLGTWAVLPVTLSLVLMAVTAGVRRASGGLRAVSFPAGVEAAAGPQISPARSLS